MQGRWPSGKRYAVGLSFDFDAETIWFRTLRQPFLGQMSRGEYGAREGVPRILELLRRYDLKATFYVPGWTADKYPHLVEQMHAAGHEIGHHGYEHEYVVNKGREVELEVLSKGIESLQRITGAVPKGYRAPGGNAGPPIPWNCCWITASRTTAAWLVATSRTGSTRPRPAGPSWKCRSVGK